MDKKSWNVGEAKQRFSEVLRRCEEEPQLIYRRDKLIAAVVRVESEEAIPGRQRPPSLGQRFTEIRELCRDEGYRLKPPSRRGRNNDFLEVLDDLAGRHERSE